MTDIKDIISKPIYDKTGKLIGNMTGRRDEVERFSNHDLSRQIESDRQKHREELKRK